ncbi:response regulator transcription factor [Pseudomonas otitidis]|uniref:Response regulator transcription factor n=1 Tax=Metapseudomonas otitidis TaxID=319939 RepID=A0ABU3XK34_9GAMM|nr:MULTISPECIES: response regulator transcription factor [Pseudomonas]MDL5601304.1 response regulator transcription factor [Bacillus subtilis]MDG9784423.1 response regulator transcription factor [Pseudomonas otitidis]MDH0337522.1 response regulator transcription factor [Pseudomonas otitidis]MDH1106320.1 response regulator transcription factor [Pseudomonas otitidis]MDH1159636.1 response regulator transcription factor [Pseudomonas otitidis]
MRTALIVDDHPVIRMAVRMLLERNGLEVVGEADNGVDAVQLVRQHEPDVVILDIGIPRLDGLNVISRIRSLGLDSHVLVLTSLPAEGFCQRCLQAGARGFVSKEEDLQNLVIAINSISAGFTFFPADVLPVGQGTPASEQELVGRLSNQELMVLQYLASGLGNKEIAERMLLSNKTVSTYKSRIQQKLNLASLLELIEFARRNDLSARQQ